MENFGQNVTFFTARAFLSELEKAGAEGSFRKIRVRQPKMDISNKYNGGPFGLAGGRIPEGGIRPSPLLNPPWEGRMPPFRDSTPCQPKESPVVLF